MQRQAQNDLQNESKHTAAGHSCQKSRHQGAHLPLAQPAAQHRLDQDAAGDRPRKFAGDIAQRKSRLRRRHQRDARNKTDAHSLRQRRIRQIDNDRIHGDRPVRRHAAHIRADRMQNDADSEQHRRDRYPAVAVLHWFNFDQVHQRQPGIFFFIHNISLLQIGQ